MWDLVTFRQTVFCVTVGSDQPSVDRPSLLV